MSWIEDPFRRIVFGVFWIIISIYILVTDESILLKLASVFALVAALDIIRVAYSEGS